MPKLVKLIHPILGFHNWTIKVPIVFGVFFSSLTVDAIIFHELWQTHAVALLAGAETTTRCGTSAGENLQRNHG